MQITKIEKNGCTPCTILSNRIHDSADELASYGVTIKTVNISEDPEAIDKYNVSSVPVLIFDHDGFQVVHNGLITKEYFLSEVASMVKSYE